MEYSFAPVAFYCQDRCKHMNQEFHDNSQFHKDWDHTDQQLSVMVKDKQKITLKMFIIEKYKFYETFLLQPRLRDISNMQHIKEHIKVHDYFLYI